MLLRGFTVSPPREGEFSLNTLPPAAVFGRRMIVEYYADQAVLTNCYRRAWISTRSLKAGRRSGCATGGSPAQTAKSPIRLAAGTGTGAARRS